MDIIGDLLYWPMSSPPIYRGGAAEFSVGVFIGKSDRLWVMRPVAGRVPSRRLRPATVAPPAAVPAAGRYMIADGRRSGAEKMDPPGSGREEATYPSIKRRDNEGPVGYAVHLSRKRWFWETAKVHISVLYETNLPEGSSGYSM
ncbi:hypothetical protein ACLOJK_035035 [Asimina triloba]